MLAEISVDTRWTLRLPDAEALAETRDLAAVLAVLNGDTIGAVIHTAVRQHALARLGPVIVEAISTASPRSSPRPAGAR